MALLVTTNLSIQFGGLKAVDNFEISIEERKLVDLIGPNCAGKTTILKTISKILAPVSDLIKFKDENIAKIPAHQIIDMGIAHVPEGRSKQISGTLSGGEQQMLAIGRALMSRPKLILMDEPSMGLAPILVDGIFDIITSINKTGTTILLVEQNANRALQIAHRGYVLETGKIIMQGTAKELLEDEKVKEAYLGG